MISVKPTQKSSAVITSQVREQAFTLIELMVVLVIMSILLAIAVPSYRAYTETGAETKCQQDILKIASQYELYKSKNYTYTGARNQRAILYPNSSTSTGFINYSPLEGGEPEDRVCRIYWHDDNNADLEYGGIFRLTAEPENEKFKYSLYYSSKGVRCKRLATSTPIDWRSIDCGETGEPW